MKLTRRNVLYLFMQLCIVGQRSDKGLSLFCSVALRDISKNIFPRAVRKKSSWLFCSRSPLTQQKKKLGLFFVQLEQFSLDNSGKENPFSHSVYKTRQNGSKKIQDFLERVLSRK